MTDRIHPSSSIPPPMNTAAGATPAAAKPATAAGRPNPQLPAAKAHQHFNPYRPRPAGVPYRPHPRRRCSGRRFCCLCFIYTLLFLLSLLLVAAAAACVFYFLYHPEHPTFSVSAVHISDFNLSSPADPAAGFSHLTAKLNFTLSAKNPNSDITFLYDQFSVAVATSGGLHVGDATLPAFPHLPGNTTIVRGTILSDPTHDLDSDSIKPLKSDLRRNRWFPLIVQVDTKVQATMGKLGSKSVGIRVTCAGPRGALPTKKGAGKKVTPSVGSAANAKCQVEPRIKIWRFSL